MRLQNVWLALLMFMGLTWLETGIGVTGWPFATALMALLMLVLSVAFMLLCDRKAFCRNACPVGRTLGYYSRLSPLSSVAKQDMMMDPIIPELAVYMLQAGLMVLGFLLAVQIVRHRARGQLRADCGSV